MAFVSQEVEKPVICSGEPFINGERLVHLDGGSMKEVYLHPNEEVVYKVFRSGNNFGVTFEEDLRALDEASKQGYPVIPVVGRWDDIGVYAQPLAQQVSEAPYRVMAEWNFAVSPFYTERPEDVIPVTDIHMGNIGYWNGQLAVFDCFLDYDGVRGWTTRPAIFTAPLRVLTDCSNGGYPFYLPVELVNDWFRSGVLDPGLTEGRPVHLALEHVYEAALIEDKVDYELLKRAVGSLYLRKGPVRGYWSRFFLRERSEQYLTFLDFIEGLLEGK